MSNYIQAKYDEMEGSSILFFSDWFKSFDLQLPLLVVVRLVSYLSSVSAPLVYLNSRGVFDSRLSMTTRCLTVSGGGSIGTCDRLSQPSWLLVCTVKWSYLLTYLHIL